MEEKYFYIDTEVMNRKPKTSAYEFWDTNLNMFDRFEAKPTISMFIGANNSRKSRFLRELFTSTLTIFNQEEIDNYLSIIEILKFNEKIYTKFQSDNIKLSLTYSISHTGNEKAIPIDAEIRKRVRYYLEHLKQKYEINIHFSSSLDELFEIILKDISEGKSLNFKNIYCRKFYEFILNILLFVKTFEISKLLLIEKSEDEEYIKYQSKFIDCLNFIIKFENESIININTLQELNLNNKLKEILTNDTANIDKIQNFISFLENLLESFLIENIPTYIYIPILRYANFNIVKTDTDTKYPLRDKVFEQYFDELENTKGESLIKTGETLYQDILEMRNSSTKKLNDFLKLQSDIGKYFFNDANLNIFSDLSVDSKKHIKFNLHQNGDDREFFNIGDGIQNLFMLLLPIYTAEKGSKIFIEEPENSMHPKFQRAFIDMILKNDRIKDKKLKIFFTTHSNHFLSSYYKYSDKINIYKFTQDQKDSNKSKIKLLTPNDNISLLKDLGIFNSSVFITNCLIWVEGVTDIYYYSQYLKMYALLYNNGNPQQTIKLIDGVTHAFTEYGGVLLKHYDFENDIVADELSFNNEMSKIIGANNINNSNFVVCDEDLRIKDKAKYNHTLYQNIEECISTNVLKKIFEQHIKYNIDTFSSLKHSVSCFNVKDFLLKNLEYDLTQTQQKKKLAYDFYKVTQDLLDDKNEEEMKQALKNVNENELISEMFKKILQANQIEPDESVLEKINEAIRTSTN